MELEINTALLITQLLNFLLLFLGAGVVVIVVYRLFMGRGPQARQVTLRRAGENSYIQLQADDIRSIDIINEQEAVVRLRDEQKVRVDAEDAQQVAKQL